MDAQEQKLFLILELKDSLRTHADYFLQSVHKFTHFFLYSTVSLS